MSLSLGYIILSAAIIFIVALIIQKLSDTYLKNDSDHWTRLLFIIPESLINPFASHRPHEIANSAELYKRLHELGIPFTLEAVVHTLGEEIYFYIIARRRDTRKVHQVTETLWPTAYLNKAEEYDLWLDGKAEKGNVVVGYFGLERPHSVPLKTALRGHFEPFLAVLRGLGSLAAVGEGAALQAIIRPADSHKVAAIGQYIDRLESGAYTPSKHLHEEFIITPETIKRIRAKASAPLFAVNFRLIASTTHPGAEQLFKNVANHIQEDSHNQAHQYNSLVAKIPKDQFTITQQFLEYAFDPNHEIILNADELATYFHMPGPTTAAPKIKR